MTEQQQLKKNLCEQHFAAVDVNLYLDTHPHDKKALEAMRKYTQKYNELKKLYEQKYGPLDIFAPINGDCWQWIDSPWPWEN